MKIDSTPAIAAATQASASAGARKPAAAEGASGAPRGTELQSAMLQPALAALREMPDIDAARVEALRAALAEGRLNFDAGKLARLIERYHGGHE